MKKQISWFGLLALLALAGCATYRVAPMRFRTMQPEQAFDRAVAAMQTHAGAIRSKDRHQGLIRSQWMAGSELRGNYYQFIAEVLDNPADESASITVNMRVVRCNMFTKHSDDKARWCDADVTPSSEEIAAFDRFRLAFRDDVFRDQRVKSRSH